MQQQLKLRLEELRTEYETGQARLRELETETQYVRETLLRISGAIQVIQEMLGQPEEKDGAETLSSEGEPTV
jgi:predicted nuclease with TOPRIM domain